MSRPTISDIARVAGVSKGAVSYALNGRRGVSRETRARILAIAKELGWVPNSAARALSGDRANVVGFIALRDIDQIATEPAVIGGASRAYPGISCLRAPREDLMVQAVDHLLALGHGRLAHVSGPRVLEHVAQRWQSFAEITETLSGVTHQQVESDFTALGGVRATHELLAGPHPPSAIIYDNDVMAVAA
jgi:DNA-binding LacI/PurR family transcriptional regulator